MGYFDTKAEKRQLERDGHCHCCGKSIKKHDETILYLNKAYGQDRYHILCFDCLKEINEAIARGELKVRR